MQHSKFLLTYNISYCCPLDNVYYTQQSEGLAQLTCIVHDINVGAQLRAGKVVAVLNWVIESGQQDE